MAVRDAASAAGVAPFAQVSEREVDPLVRFYVASRRGVGVPWPA